MSVTWMDVVIVDSNVAIPIRSWLFVVEACEREQFSYGFDFVISSDQTSKKLQKLMSLRKTQSRLVALTQVQQLNVIRTMKASLPTRLINSIGLKRRSVLTRAFSLLFCLPNACSNSCMIRPSSIHPGCCKFTVRFMVTPVFCPT